MSLDDQVRKIEDERTGLAEAVRKISVWDWTKSFAYNAAAAYATGGLIFGTLNVATTIVSFIASNYLINGRKGFTKNSVQNDINFSAAYTVSLSAWLSLLDRYFATPLAWMMGYGGSLPAFTVITNGMKHFIEKYSPWTFVKGLLKMEPVRDVGQIVKNIPEGLKNGAKASAYLTLPVGASRFLLPREYLIPSLFPLRTGLKYFTTPKKYAPQASYNVPYPAAA